MYRSCDLRRNLTCSQRAACSLHAPALDDARKPATTLPDRVPDNMQHLTAILSADAKLVRVDLSKRCAEPNGRDRLRTRASHAFDERERFALLVRKHEPMASQRRSLELRRGLPCVAVEAVVRVVALILASVLSDGLRAHTLRARDDRAVTSEQHDLAFDDACRAWSQLAVTPEAFGVGAIQLELANA